MGVKEVRKSTRERVFVITWLSGRAADACLELVDRREDALYAGPSAGTTL